jgi:hypothetical protein
MIAMGIEPHVAVATNMMALIFMRVGGSLPFAQKGVIERNEYREGLFRLAREALLHFQQLHSYQAASFDSALTPPKSDI